MTFEKPKYSKLLIFSLLYSLLGVISLLGIMKDSPIYAEYFYFGVLICLPIDFISLALLFTSNVSIWTILIIQFITFFLLWRLLTAFTKKSQ